MGLFDRFKKRLSEVVDEVDTDAISAEGGSNEALDAIEQSKPKPLAEETPTIQEPEDTSPVTDDEDWEILDDETDTNASVDEDDDWEDFDDEEDFIPRQLSRKEKKRQQKEQKRIEKAKKAYEKSMKKRGASEVARPKGSKVDLSMMRTTTGRKLVEVAQSPKGSTKSAEIATEAGSTIKVDLGGGVVEQGGRVIKPSIALDNMLEELEWVLLESDISSDAVTAVIEALKTNLIGSRLRKGADLSKVVEAALKRSLKGLLAAGYWDFDASVQSFIESGDLSLIHI